MNAPQSINPLDTAMACPNCQANAACVSALANGGNRFYVYICSCGAILIIADAQAIGSITRPSEAGIDQVIGLILFKPQSKILVPGRKVPFAPNPN